MLRNEIYDDIYFNADDGIGESEYVFLDGSGAPDIWRNITHFHITELGFGTGLNFLLTAQAWQKTASADAHLTYTGIDLHPFTKSKLQEVYAHWPDLSDVSEKLLAVYPGTEAGIHICYPVTNITLMLLWGEAMEMLQSMHRKQNLFYLDGFAPKKNPEMWRDEIYSELARLAAPNAFVTTFTAAGMVKRGLENAGFTVTKRKGFGNKRERITAKHV
ncbi:MAG TPA: tRNA (5-methylaminomethyl-2-thiouridine)(34)-methyltransferase MnmD [Alphaproteobacteria bacterium]|nr:tRNA (5-methylaminomethyl-2-thiouridine)(34)-methyltransferase MnmD [Alphaproteobacteria bacterium]